MVQEMQNENWRIATFVILCITASICIILCLWTIYCLFIKNGKKNENKLSVWITLICIIFHTILGILDPIGFYFYQISSLNDSNPNISTCC